MVEKLFYILHFVLCILAFSCIFHNSTLNTQKYPTDVTPIEGYPIEAYLVGKGVIEISGCHRKQR
jgi:hypothetical protein